jgi:hypothetical protein
MHVLHARQHVLRHDLGRFDVIWDGALLLSSVIKPCIPGSFVYRACLRHGSFVIIRTFGRSGIFHDSFHDQIVIIWTFYEVEIFHGNNTEIPAIIDPVALG